MLHPLQELIASAHWWRQVGLDMKQERPHCLRPPYAQFRSRITTPCKRAPSAGGVATSFFRACSTSSKHRSSCRSRKCSTAPARRCTVSSPGTRAVREARNQLQCSTYTGVRASYKLVSQLAKDWRVELQRQAPNARHGWLSTVRSDGGLLCCSAQATREMGTLHRCYARTSVAGSACVSQLMHPNILQ